MKKLLLFIAFVSAFTMVRAQRQNTYFLKYSGKYVKERDSADFIRIIQEPEEGQTNYKVNEYYLDGTRKFTSTASKIEPLVYEGDFITFDKKGNKDYEATYSNGHPVGKVSLFYKNGVLKEQLEYEQSTVQPSNYFRKSKLIYYADSLGNVMVKEGSGHYLRKDERAGKDEYVEEGDYKNGLRVGEWTLKSRSGNYWYKELYEEDKLIKGESFKDGVNYEYQETEKQPEYAGGMSAFYKYIGRETRYPNDAVKAKVKGRVFLSFIVEKDGTITDVNVDRGVYPSLDQEAQRVLLKSPKWIPGQQHGIPVRVKYNLPLNFAIN